MIFLSVAHDAIARGAANSKFGINEYECSQKMTQACQDALRAEGVEAMYYDIGHITPHKAPKIRAVNLHDPQLAVEIHLNSAESVGNYVSCFHNRGNEQTSMLSDYICSSVVKCTGVKRFKSVAIPEPGYDTERYWFVTKTDPPAIIVEPLFMNNDKHMEWLMTGDNIHLLGQSIGKAIALWVGRKKESSETKSQRLLG